MKTIKLFCVLLLILCSTQSTYAHDFIIGGICYNKTSETTVEVTFYGEDYRLNNSTYQGNIIIPSVVSYNSIEYSVISIGENAFRYSSLTSVIIPNSVTSIGQYAFYNCSGLTEVELYSNAIVSKNYSSGSGFANIFGPQVKKYIIGEGVTSIGYRAFEGCRSLVSVSIPNSVMSIARSAFSGCSNLTEVELNSNAIVSNSTDTDEIILSDCSLANIFGSQVKKYNIGEDVMSIGVGAFYECHSLSSIILPNSVTSIGCFAFYECRALTSITIPCSVASIEGYTFYNCSGLASIDIPNSVTSIGEYAFSGCSGLTSIDIPNSVTSFANYIFSGCSALTSITIPTSVTSIGDGAFYGCSGLTSITIPNSVTSIGDGAFQECSGLTSITIPNSVTSVGYGAFQECSSLTEVELNSNKIVSEDYSSEWSFVNIFGSQVKKYIIGDDVTSIGDCAFSGCSALTSITIPNSVTSIGDGAFWDCSALTSITIPNSVTSIGRIAFYGCKGLTSIDIPNSVTSIADNIFFGCSGLTSVTIPNSVTTINYGVFYGCRNLTSITIPNSVTSIGYGAFQECSSLTSITIPNSVTSIGGEAFKNCSGLVTVMIGNAVKDVGTNLFSGCTTIETVVSFAPAQVSDFFYDSKNANIWVLPSVREKYNGNSRIHPIYEYTSTQSTISISSSEKFVPVSIESEGKALLCSDGIFKMDGLVPNRQYALTISGIIDGENYTFTDNISTKSIPLHLDFVDATNHTLKVSHYYEGDAVIVKEGIRYKAQNESSWNDWFGPDATCITNLKPGKNYTVQYYVMAKDEKEYSKSITCSTKPLDYSIDYTPGVTKCKGIGNCYPIDLTIEKMGFEDAEGAETEWSNLEPNSEYTKTFYVDTKESGRLTYSKSFLTKGVTIETQAAKATSDKKAMLWATTNCDDEELRYGFEWRRYDAPEEMPSNIVNCPMYNGAIAGTLNNLSSTTYYKYRPFYQSVGGKTYYGDWIAFITADAYVYFEPEVHTYEAQEITENSAKVRGYVLTGSDDVEEQGFEYWSGSDDVKTAKASGMMMTATLSDLKANTEYHCRSFVKTEKKTTYGEDMTFHTAIATAVEEVSTSSAEDLTSFDLYTMNGILVQKGLTSFPSLNRGVYIMKNGNKYRKIYIK